MVSTGPARGLAYRPRPDRDCCCPPRARRPRWHTNDCERDAGACARPPLRGECARPRRSRRPPRDDHAGPRCSLVDGDDADQWYSRTRFAGALWSELAAVSRPRSAQPTDMVLGATGTRGIGRGPRRNDALCRHQCDDRADRPVLPCRPGLAPRDRIPVLSPGCSARRILRAGRVVRLAAAAGHVLGADRHFVSASAALSPCSVSWRKQMMVDLILLERVEKLGQMGQLVKVKPGFARNYLLPQKKALRATKENLTYFESQRTQLEANNLERKSEATEVGTTLEGLSVIIVRQAGESGQLYGSVSARDLADAVTEAGFTIEKRQVVLERPIKSLGMHSVRIVLHPEVSVMITANVAQSAEEAAMQARGIDPLRLRDGDDAEADLAATDNPTRRQEPAGTRAG